MSTDAVGSRIASGCSADLSESQPRISRTTLDFSFYLVHAGAVLLAIGSAWTTAESVHSTIYSANWGIPWTFAGGFGALLLGCQLYLLRRMQGFRIAELLKLMLVASLSICFNFDIFYRSLGANEGLVRIRQKAADHYQSSIAQIERHIVQELERMESDELNAQTNFDFEIEGRGHRQRGYGPLARSWEEKAREIRVRNDPKRRLLKEAHLGIHRLDDTFDELARAGSLEEARTLTTQLNYRIAPIARTVGMNAPIQPTIDEVRGLGAIGVLIEHPSITGGLCLTLAILIDCGALLVGTIFVQDSRSRIWTQYPTLSRLKTTL